MTHHTPPRPARSTEADIARTGRAVARALLCSLLLACSGGERAADGVPAGSEAAAITPEATGPVQGAPASTTPSSAQTPGPAQTAPPGGNPPSPTEDDTAGPAPAAPSQMGAQPTTAPGRSAFHRIEAEDFDAMQGIELEGGGTRVGYVDEGDWLRYDGLNFGTGGAHKLALRMAGWQAGRQIEVRLDGLDGALLALIDVPETGGLTRFETRLFDVDEPTGPHDLWLVGRGGNGVLNLDYLLFSSDQPPEAPSGLSAVVRSDSEVDLSWIDESALEAGYHVYWSSRGTKPATPQLALPAGATGASLQGLTPGTPYTLWIEAHNPVGASLASSVQALTTGLRPSIEDFTLVLIPDTQMYVSESDWYSPGQRPEKRMYSEQISWILASQETMNIAFVTHVGDVVDYEDDVSEWEFASAEQARLEAAGMPNGIAPGNHDLHAATYEGAHNFWEDFFPASRYSNFPWWGGNYNGNSNSYQLFSAGGMDFIIVHLGWGIRDDEGARAWASSLLDLHADRRAIVVTHAILEQDGSAIWNDVISGHDNVFLFLGGHTCADVVHETRIHGGDRAVEQFMVDFQCNPFGGGGKLAYFTFRPTDGQVEFSVHNTFSPMDLSRWDRSFPYEMN